MSIKTSNFIGYLAVLVRLSACQSPTQNNENITISKASILPLSSPQKTKETIAFFYSYNSNNSKLEWTAMELKESSNNKLQDAINAFIIYYQKAGVGDQLELKSVEKYNNKQVLSFSGKPDFKIKKDSTIFWTAMDMTISRNIDEDYRIEIE